MNVTLKKACCRILLIVMFFVEQFGLAFALLNRVPLGISLSLLALIGTILLQIWYQRLVKQKTMRFHKSLKLIVVLLIVLLVVEETLAHFSTVSANQQFIDHFLNKQSTKWIMIFIGTVVAPVIEEGAFRTGIMGNTKHPIIFSIISTILFTLMHMTSSKGSLLFLISNIAQYSIISLFLCMIYYRTKDWKANTITHVLWNLVAMVTYFLF